MICGVLGLGALSVGLVMYSQSLTYRDFDVNASLMRLVQTVQQDIATAHLWFEEALGGDASIDLETDVHAYIRSAMEQLEEALATEDDAASSINALPQVHDTIVELVETISLFDRLVDSRWATRDSTGIIGGGEDEIFDAVFHDILQLSRKVADETDSYLESNQRSIVLVNNGMIAILVLIFTALTVLIVWNRRALDARAATLEHLVRERTASLAKSEANARRRNVELAEARDQARAASEAKSQFLANMSHEIRTPMNGVMGIASLLKRTRLDATQQEYVETMHQSGLSLLRIINEILDFSKIEAGKISLDNADFSVRSVIEDVLQLFSAEAARKNLEFGVSVDDEVPDCLHGDPVRLGQILSNLVSNAIKFTDQGAITLKCRSDANSTVQDQRISLRFEISDTGIGIDVDDQRRLFEKFSQADPSSTRRHGGTGLGLAISRELTFLMNGEIGVESRVGEGSTFWFTATFLPGDDAATGEWIDVAGARSGFGTGWDSTGGGQRDWSHVDKPVLVVDDNEINLLVAQRMLEALGFTVELATNGGDAVAASAQSEFAAILIDSQMPGMDGNEATRLIREAEGPGTRTPIIALTANAMVPDREKAFSAGVDDYLSKPVFLEDLEAVFARLLPALNVSDIRPADSKSEPKVISADLRPVSAVPDSAFAESIVSELSGLGPADGPNLFAELAGKFQVHMPDWLDELQAAASAGDMERVRRLAHKLLGLCRQIGATRMAGICDALEADNGDYEPDLLRREVDTLRREFLRASRELTERHLT